MNIKLLLGGIACIAAEGCTTTSGPKAVITADGATDTTTTTGVVKKFSDAASASFNATEDTAAAKRMMGFGFSLVRANCNDFFSTAGTTQKWILLTRDVIGAVGTLSTGILALHDGSKNAIANVALATSFGFTSLDIYTKNFLFGAENVNSIRELVLRALDTHRQGVEALGAVTYEVATNHVIDNQAICSDAKILALARDAIARGVVVASTSPASDLATITQLQDQRVLQALGQSLNPPGALTTDQAGALWWLLKEFSTAAEKTSEILPKIKDIPSATNPLDANGAYKPNWMQAEEVAKALERFSETTKASFRKTIEAARAGRSEAAATKRTFTVPSFGLPPVIRTLPIGANMAREVSNGEASSCT